MAVNTWYVSKQMIADTGAFGGGAANPGDAHIPMGKWDPGTGLGWVTRALLYAPISFTGMTGINAAYLVVRAHTTPGWHANGQGTKSIRIRRKTADWAESSAGTSTAVDELWGGNGASLVVDHSTFDGDADFAASTDLADGSEIWIPITNTVKKWHAGNGNYGVKIEAASEGSYLDAYEFYSRHVSGLQPRIVIDYNTNTAPLAPHSVSPTGNALVNTGTNITVSGSRNDADPDDFITGVDLRMYKDDGVTLVDSDTYYPTGTPTGFSRVMSVPVGNAYYRWAGRTRDRENAWGAWTSHQRFKANTAPNAPAISVSQTPINAIKTLTPTLNITRSDADSGDTMTAYRIILETWAGAAVWDSGDVGTAATTVSASRAYNGPALSWRTAYRWRARTRDTNNVWGPYSSNLVVTTYSAPAPVSLSPNSIVGSLTPTFTFNRSGTEHTITNWQIQLYESNGTTLKWDSGLLTSGITNGATVSKLYNGAVLSYDTQYKWRARIQGNIGGLSNWTSLVTFTTPSATSVTQTAPVGSPITTLTPTFTGSWNENLNAVQIIVYEANGTTVKWDSGTVTQTSAATYSRVYSGPALLWNTTYLWKIRVRRSADNVFQPYTGQVSFTTDSAGQPTLTAPIDNSWETTLTPTFTGTTFNSEVISTYRIKLYEADGISLTWDSGDLAGSGTSFSKVYDGANPLVAGRSYKWEARYTKSTGPTGEFSAFEDFHINADPTSPSNVQPETGAIVVDTLTPEFSAVYEDADLSNWSDFPVQMEIEVRDNATDTLIATQVKTADLIAGENAIVWDGTPALVYETTYKWRIRYRDSKNVDGAWSSFNTFKPSQSSDVTITNPTAEFYSPQVPVTWTYVSPGGKPQGTYQVRVIRNDDEIVVYDSGVVLSTSNNHTIPAGHLVNNTVYTFEVTVVDTDGI